MLVKIKKRYYIIIMEGIERKSGWGGARKGAGRKPTGKKTKCVFLTLTLEQAEKLYQDAEHADMTVSQYVVKRCLLPVSEKQEKVYKPRKKDIRFENEPDWEMPVAAEVKHDYGIHKSGD